VLDFLWPTKFKLIATVIVAAIVHLYGWIRPRVLTYYVSNSEITQRKPELEKMFREMFLVFEGEQDMIQRVMFQTLITNFVLIVLLGYIAACAIAKLGKRENLH
jgi:hypothetical protein